MKKDYKIYRLKISEFVFCFTLYLVLLCGISILFFNSLLPVLFLLPLEIGMMKGYANRQKQKRMERLVIEFREMIFSLAANMQAGYSLERACYAVYDEMKNLYQGNSYIEEELLHILRGLEMNKDIEALLLDFGERTGNDDILEFAQVVTVAKKSGGNLIRIIKKSADTIGEKIEVENEIDTTITAKRLEQRIMSLMPFGIIAYLRFANKGYMDSLYENTTGRVVMIVCLLMIGAATVWGNRIVNIEV